jgi:hypothetical protein
VVRGLGAEVVVDHSVDGEAWSVITLDGMVGAFPAGTTARYVRLRGKTDEALLPTLTEVSVW